MLGEAFVLTASILPIMGAQRARAMLDNLIALGGELLLVACQMVGYF